MHKVSFLTILVCVAVPAAGADLMHVYRLALDNDMQLRAAYHARQAVRENKPLARAVLLPQLTANAAYGVQRTETTEKEDSGEVTRSDVSNPYDYGVELTQVLFDLGDFLRFQRAADEVAVAEAEYLAEEQALILRTAEAYFAVLAAQDNLRFATAESKAVAEQQEQAEGRFQAGIAPYTDVQEAEAQYDLTLAAIVAAERLLQLRREALGEIIGREEIELAPLREEIPLPEPSPDEPDPWVEAAFESNLELVAARLRAEIAERDVGISRSAYLPSLRLEGEQRFGETAGFNRGDFEAGGVSVNVELPLFTGLGRRSEVRRSNSLHEQRLAEFEGTRRAVERLTRDAFLGVTTGAAQVRALGKAVRSNETALEASEAGLRVGTRTIVDVLNAQRLLFQAERDHAGARYRYLLNILLLKRAAGSLQAQDLSEINALLSPGSPGRVAGPDPTAG